MEDRVRKELKKTNKMINSLTKKLEREIRPKEIDKIKRDLIRLEGRFESYMEVLKMFQLKRLEKWLHWMQYIPLRLLYLMVYLQMVQL